MNPSYADAIRGDGNVDFLTGYLLELSYGGVIVINTSAIIKSSNATKGDFPESDPENEAVIRKISEPDPHSTRLVTGCCPDYSHFFM
ncbi:DUF1643 domain-containing protein [Salisediminibacterium beveridgei]|nr:DUF1643 domain-containing protein [Salisediminibacterium beveridgei]